ncbi:O-methyltransferase [Dentipellis sp. KUC8613]|nr:O-methyltransferase [Dentipellis sp. KUC8613]
MVACVVCDYRSNGTDTLAELKALSDLIKSNIDRIEAASKSTSLEFPSPWTPFTPPSEAGRMIPDVVDATTQVVAAASQLIAAVRPPPLTIISMGYSFYVPAALRVVVEAHVSEFLREAGKQGAHVKDIAKPTDIDPAKLARILRLLASNHVFVEVAPDVFANNRLSSFLDSGKSVATLVAHPEQTYDATSGITAALGHFGDESFKAAAYLPDTLFDPAMAHSSEANKTAANKAFNMDLDWWSWYETPGNEYRGARFAHAMNGTRAFLLPKAIMEGFDWKDLKDGAVVVDVGGGVGSQCLTLAEDFSHLNFIVQDRAPVVAEGEKFWQINKPDFVKAGKVKFQPYDFIHEKQPVKNADVFIIRAILHDWADEYCVTILRSLREAATPTTRLLVIDNIISYASQEEDVQDIPGAKGPQPPAPLLPNWGQAGAVAYLADLQMLTCLNGQERTVTHLRNLLAKTGWKLVEVRRGTETAFSLKNVIAVPV